MYWIVRRLWLPILSQLLWWGWKALDPPPPAQIALCTLAMFALAGAAKYLVYATHHIDQAYRLAELCVLTAGWAGVLAIVVLLALNVPTVAMAAGGFLLYAALDAFPSISARIGDVGRRALVVIRFERAALRRDDPNWKPATVSDFWPRKNK